MTTSTDDAADTTSDSTVQQVGDAAPNSGTHRPVELSPAAVAIAREAAIQDSGSATLVGELLTAETEDEVAVTVRFGTTDVAYTGWAWCVTIALVDPEQPTVSEVVLLPGPGALLPPPWLPWSQRIRPGDLGPGDLLVPAPDDPRLVPAYLESDDPAVEDVAHELGIGRVQVMSRAGRTDTAERWHEGAFGPDSEMAKAAPLTCVMCAFYLPLAGSLAAQFGACGNELSPADGRVVDVGYGCGAHSELVIEPVPTGFRESHIDDTVLDVHPRLPGQSDGPAEFVTDQPTDLEFQPVHPAAVGAELVVAPVLAELVESTELVESAGDATAAETVPALGQAEVLELTAAPAAGDADA